MMAEKERSQRSFTPPFRAKRRNGKEVSPGQSPLVSRKRARSDQNMYKTSEATNEPDFGFLRSASVSSFSLMRMSSKERDLSYLLHDPKNAQVLHDLLQRRTTDPEVLNDKGDTPLHTIVKSQRQDKVELLLTLLTHSCADVNRKVVDGMTALHFTAQIGDFASARVLLAFGADINVVNSKHQTPLDVATIFWVAHLRDEKVYNGTNALSTVFEHDSSSSSTTSTDFPTCPDVVGPTYTHKSNGAAAYDPPLAPRIRNDSNTSWIVIDVANGANGTASGKDHLSVPSLEASIERSGQSSIEDSREFSSSVMPIKRSDIVDEQVSNTGQEVVDSAVGMSTVVTTQQRHKYFEFLYSVGAYSGKSKKSKFNKVSRLRSFSESGEFPENALEGSVKLKDYEEGKTVLTLCEELQEYINSKMESQESLSASPDEAMALIYQQKELVQYNKTRKLASPHAVHGIGYDVRGGSRILFLDGGGMKGLVQIEIMSQLEKATGRKITELFDWIVGSSIGGVFALAMVYAKKSLDELRRLCFKMKDEVFSNPKAGFAFNTKALEKIFQEVFGLECRMSDITSPKVLIVAVNKKQAPLQIHHFNNCFDDEFSTELVWKVARYTSAAPIFFTEFENYVDGGVMANNPSDCGLSAIQNFHRQHHIDLPIALVVSIGTGIYPSEELGRADAHEFLFFGKHWFNFKDTIKKRTQNLISLISNALVESETVAKNCGVRCAEQGIPYYRFSPELDQVIPAGETDSDKLIEMIMQTKRQTRQQGLPQLVKLFHDVAEASRKLRYRNSRRYSRSTLYSPNSS